MLFCSPCLLRVVISVTVAFLSAQTCLTAAHWNFFFAPFCVNSRDLKLLCVKIPGSGSWISPKF
ncbi:hypothetical protein PGIGA_G00006350 [Pangasianodon gigas]|uniref:Uncharacterized protein n=1 Tax=Pangasianodon gigas TaxID=30993 RepID=A0ACC5W6I4_PANGG|nr:hypothetical protein [Pangasianodon gigas]